MTEYEFEIWQDDMPVASSAGPDRDRALQDALHYVSQYAQDGPCMLVEVTRTVIDLNPTHV